MKICLFRGKTSQTKYSKHIFTHIAEWGYSAKPSECIGYHPPAPSRPRMKGVIANPEIAYKILFTKYVQNLIFQQMRFVLNLGTLFIQKHSREVDLYLYTKEQVVIPRWSAGVYGSVHKRFWLKANATYLEKLHVRKNKFVAIDRSKRRCSNDPTSETLGRCIVRYIESVVECTSHQAMSDMKMRFCNKSTARTKARQEITQFWDMSEDEIFNKTGCIPSCTRDEIKLVGSDDRRIISENGEEPKLILLFIFEDGSYHVRQEYFVYDTGSFLADVGGYLGLILGYSLLGLYNTIADWMAETNIMKIRI